MCIQKQRVFCVLMMISHSFLSPRKLCQLWESIHQSDLKASFLSLRSMTFVGSAQVQFAVLLRPETHVVWNVKYVPSVSQNVGDVMCRNYLSSHTPARPMGWSWPIRFSFISERRDYSSWTLQNGGKRELYYGKLFESKYWSNRLT